MKNNKLGAALIALLLSTCMMSGHLMAQIHYEWAKSFGGYSFDGASAVALDGSGNVYTASYFSDTMIFNPGPNEQQFIGNGGGDIFLTKCDPDGNFIWAKQIGGPASDQPFDMKVDSDGNLVITGVFSNTVDFDPGEGVSNLTSFMGFDFFVGKYDPEGNFIWVKGFGGNSAFDNPCALVCDPLTGDIVVTGYFGASVDFDPGTGVFAMSADLYDAFILRLTTDGNFLWAGKIGGLGFDVGNSLALDQSGNIILAGIFEETADFDPSTNSYFMSTYNNEPMYADGFIEKLSPEGELIWVVKMGGPGQDWANGVVVDPFGDIVVTGEFFSDVDFDPSEAEYILSSRNSDIFVWKLDSESNLIWAEQMGGTNHDWATALTTDDLGNIYSTGYFMETGDFDPGDKEFLLTAGAYNEVYISKLTRDGSFSWAMAFEGNVYYDVNIDCGYDIAVDNEYNIYTVGNFESWVDVDPGSPIEYITAHDYMYSGFYYEDGFIHKLSQNTTSVADLTTGELTIFPNPVKDKITVNTGNEIHSLQAEIRDITGKVVYSSQYNDVSTINIPVSLQQGVYILLLKDNDGRVYSEKFVKSL